MKQLAAAALAVLVVVSTARGVTGCQCGTAGEVAVGAAEAGQHACCRPLPASRLCNARCCGAIERAPAQGLSPRPDLAPPTVALAPVALLTFVTPPASFAPAHTALVRPPPHTGPPLRLRV